MPSRYMRLLQRQAGFCKAVMHYAGNAYLIKVVGLLYIRKHLSQAWAPRQGRCWMGGTAHCDPARNPLPRQARLGI